MTATATRIPTCVYLEVTSPETGHTFTVSFAGPDQTFNGSVYASEKVLAGYSVVPVGWETGRLYILEDAIAMAEMERSGVDLTAVCEHGLAQWLCSGPQHYPFDEEGV